MAIGHVSDDLFRSICCGIYRDRDTGPDSLSVGVLKVKILQYANNSKIITSLHNSSHFLDEYLWVKTYKNIQRKFRLWQLRPDAKENKVPSSFDSLGIGS